MADVFGDAPADDPLETLVGEGKKFREVKDVAKGYLSAQDHITRLEAENQQFREDIGSRKTVEEQLERYRQDLNTQRQNDSQGDTSRQDQNSQGKPQSDEDLVKRIREVTQETEQQRTREHNLMSVTDRLEQVYGSADKSKEVIMSKAKEVGLTSKDLENLAGRSPKALFDLLGLEQNRTQTANGTPRQEVNTQALNRGTRTVEGSKADWDQRFKDQPSLRTNPEAQRKRMNDAQRLGEAFFDS